MAISLTVGNDTWQFPESGDSPNWGPDVTGWAQSVTDLLQSLQSADDIGTTTFSIANNISSATNINGLMFNNSTVRSAIVEYSIYRVTNTDEVAESGTINVVYKNNANTWELQRTHADEAGIEFSVLSSGQFQYTSSNLSGTGYSGVIKFRARTLPQ